MNSNVAAPAGRYRRNFFVSLCLCGFIGMPALAALFFMNHRDTESQRRPLPDYVNHVSGTVVDAAFSVHSQLGPGLLESVYEKCLAHAIRRRGMIVERQIVLPIEFEGLRVSSGLRLDILVNDCVVVEVKAAEAILPVHKAQLMTYLKLSGYRLGLLINFNVPIIKNGITRIAC